MLVWSINLTPRSDTIQACRNQEGYRDTRGIVQGYYPSRMGRDIGIHTLKSVSLYPSLRIPIRATANRTAKSGACVARLTGGTKAAAPRRVQPGVPNAPRKGGNRGPRKAP